MMHRYRNVEPFGVWQVIFVGRVRLSFCDYGMRLVGRNRETWVQVPSQDLEVIKFR